MSVGRGMYHNSQFNWFFNLNITKKVSKKQYCLHLSCLLYPSKSSRLFFETHKNML